MVTVILDISHVTVTCPCTCTYPQTQSHSRELLSCPECSTAESFRPMTRSGNIDHPGGEEEGGREGGGREGGSGRGGAGDTG